MRVLNGRRRSEVAPFASRSSQATPFLRVLKGSYWKWVRFLAGSDGLVGSKKAGWGGFKRMAA